MLRFNNDRFGTHTSIDKINTKYRTKHTYLDNIWTVYKLQCSSFTNDIYNNIHVKFFSNLSVIRSKVISLIFIYKYLLIIQTWHILLADKHNFIYNCIITWNEYLLDILTLSKQPFTYININYQFCALSFIIYLNQGYMPFL